MRSKPLFDASTPRKPIGLSSVPERQLFNPEYPHLHASPDGAIIKNAEETEESLHGILEIKCPSSYVFSRFLQEGIDPSYYAQLQHYLLVTGLNWGSFAIFCADQWRLHWFDVERDEEIIAKIKEVTEEFWTNHIVPQVRPDDIIIEEARIVPRARIGAKAVQVSGTEWAQALMDLKVTHENKKLYEKAYETAKERVQGLMGENEKIVYPGIGKVNWTETVTRSIDKDALKEEMPEVYARFERRTIGRRFTPNFK